LLEIGNRLVAGAPKERNCYETRTARWKRTRWTFRRAGLSHPAAPRLALGSFKRARYGSSMQTQAESKRDAAGCVSG